MNILISTNSKYLMATIVMLKSLFENNNCEISIYLIYSGLTSDEISTLRNFIESENNSSLILLEIDGELFANAPVFDQFTKEIYYRLLAQDILPKDIKRVLYLDVDIIINKPLKQFYYQDFDDNFLVVCEGIGTSKKDKKTYENLSIPFDKKYFNSGVILYNLELLREKFNTEIFFDFIKKKSDVLKWPDQDVLNAIFYDNVKYNDYKIYNYGILHIKNEEDETNMRNNTVILHYIGSRKPWDYKYMGNLDDIFWKYAKMTSYRNKYYTYKVMNFLYKNLKKRI